MPGLPNFKVFSEKFAALQSLTKLLPKTIPLATKDDQIYQVFNRIPVPADPAGHWEVFNKHMDALFAHELRNETGRLVHVRRGPRGMDLVLKYIKESMDAGNLLWDVAAIKIDRLLEDLKILMYLLPFFVNSSTQDMF